MKFLCSDGFFAVIWFDVEMKVTDLAAAIFTVTFEQHILIAYFDFIQGHSLCFAAFPWVVIAALRL